MPSVLKLLVLGAAYSEAESFAMRGSIVVDVCDGSSATQQWSKPDLDTKFGQVKLSDGSGCLAWRLMLPHSLSQDPLVLEPCISAGQNTSTQEWGFLPSGEIVVGPGSKAAGFRVDVSNYGGQGPHSVVWIDPKTGGPNQQWEMQPTEPAGNGVLLVSKQTR